jgi:OmpA-OmpF porin, OOP family
MGQTVGFMNNKDSLNKLMMILSLALMLPSPVNAQNIVPNPSFEEYVECPENGFYELHLCKDWKDPAGTVDYYNVCRATSVFDKNGRKSITSHYGSQSPNNGNGFVGLILFAGKNFYNREYLQCKLLKSMEAGVSYRVSFYIAVGKNSDLYSDHISLCFSSSSELPFTGTNPNPNAVNSLHRHGITFSCKGRVKVKGDILKNKEWTAIEFDYVAKGGENYLTIGSFLEDMSTKAFRRIISRNHNSDDIGTSKICYYYIDDVSVVQSDQKVEFSHQH